MAAEEVVRATLITSRHYITSTIAHLERLLLRHCSLIQQLFVCTDCAVWCRSNHRVLMCVHETFLNRCVVSVCLIHFEDGLLLRRYCQTQIDLSCNLGCSLHTCSILDGYLLILVDRDDATVGKHILGQFTLSDELQIVT